MAPQTVRERLDARFGSLKKDRTHFEHEWRLIQRFVAPNRGHFQSAEEQPGRGDYRNIINATATRAVRNCANGLMANVINPASPWFRLVPQDDDLLEKQGVSEWIDDLETRAYQVLEAGGFYAAAQVALTELVLFGTGALSEEESFDTVKRYCPWTIGSYWIANGVDGKATSIYREWKMSVEDMVREFRPENCSDAVNQAWDAGNLDERFAVRHVIEPYSDRFASVPGLSRWPFVSLYYDPADPRKNQWLRAGGNSTCPVRVVRWDQRPPYAYGRGPTADALSDVAALQSVERDLVMAAQRKAANGAWQGPAMNAASGSVNPFRQERGAYNPVTNAQAIQPLVDPRSIQIADMQWYHQILEDRIAKALFNDLFLMFLNSDRRQMTATETMERAREKLLIGPALHAINRELLSPTIDSVVSTILEESAPYWKNNQPGLVSVPPKDIQSAQIKVEYVSELQQSQRLTRAQPIYQLAAFVGQYASLDPSLPMKFDFAQAVDELAEATGVPGKVVRDDDTMHAMMAEQDAAAAQQQQMAQQQQQVQMLEKLGKARTDPGSLLGDVSNAQEAA